MEAIYVELHCHSNFSFLDGASHVEELVLQARELGYPALALTDHNGLYGAMEFARAARAWEIQPITGAEVTLASGHHLTLLVETPQGYANLCRLITASHIDFDNPRQSLENRGNPRLDPVLFERHAEGLIALSGCRQGEIPTLLDQGRFDEAREVALRYRDLFGPESFFIELQRNLVDDDAERVRKLLRLAGELDLPVVATNNVHYHVRARSRLQDVLVAIRNRTTLEASHRIRRPNSEFFLKSADQMARLFADLPEALANTLRIAERCSFDLSTDLQYRFPDYWEAQGLHDVASGRAANKEENGRTPNSPLPSPPPTSREGTEPLNRQCDVRCSVPSPREAQRSSGGGLGRGSRSGPHPPPRGPAGTPPNAGRGGVLGEVVVSVGAVCLAEIGAPSPSPSPDF